MGELTRKAASSPIPNPLSDFPSVWCAAVPPSSSRYTGFSVFSMPFYRHQSVWRRDTTRPVSPGVGHEFVKLESCLFLFFSSPLHFTLSPRFSRRASEPFPPGSPQRDKGFFGIFGRIRDGGDTRRCIISSSFNFQFSAMDVERGKKSRYLFQFR